MPHRGFDLVRTVHATLARLATELPDFHFVTISGPGVLNLDDLASLILVFVGRETSIETTDGSEDGVHFFYGDDTDDGIRAMELLGDDLTNALRVIEQSVNEPGEQLQLMPMIRGHAAPFIYAGAIVAMGKSLPEDVKTSFAELGADVTLEGLPTVFRGHPIAGEGGNFIQFAGELLARRSSGDDGWDALWEAVKQERFQTEHILVPFFEFARDLLHAFITLHELGERFEKSEQSPSPPEAFETIPALDTTNGQWVRNKVAADLEGVQSRTLASYRQLGTADPDNMVGRDKDGRVWRRQGTADSHPWYLRSTLKSAQKP